MPATRILQMRLLPHPVMPSEQDHIDVPMARVVLVSGHVVEVHIRDDARIDIAGIRASMLARRELLGDRKGPILFLAIGDLDWEAAVLQTDLFGEDAHSITAMGVLVNNRVLAMVANTYFGLFPAAFPTRIDSDEAALREWLAGL